MHVSGNAGVKRKTAGAEAHGLAPKSAIAEAFAVRIAGAASTCPSVARTGWFDRPVGPLAGSYQRMVSGQLPPSRDVATATAVLEDDRSLCLLRHHRKHAAASAWVASHILNLSGGLHRSNRIMEALIYRAAHREPGTHDVQLDLMLFIVEFGCEGHGSTGCRKTRLCRVCHPEPFCGEGSAENV